MTQSQQQQVYRVDQVNLDNPQAVRDALGGARTTTRLPHTNKKNLNPLAGIDLNNHASVAIVDYIPVESNNSSDENNNNTTTAGGAARANGEEDDDGFKPVLTKRVRKAEKLRLQKAAEAAAAAAAQAALIAKARVPKSKPAGNNKQPQQQQQSSGGVAGRRVEPLMSKSVSNKAVVVSKKEEATSSSSSSSSWANSAASTPAPAPPPPPITSSSSDQQQQQQSHLPPVGHSLVDHKRVVVSSGVVGGSNAPLSPSVDFLNLKIESTKKVWELSRDQQESGKSTVRVHFFLCLFF